MKKLPACLLILSLMGCVSKEVRIALQPYEEFDEVLLDSIRNTLSKTYEVEVEILPSKKIPDRAAVNIKSPRYRADSLISILKREKQLSFDYIIGFTHRDISTTKRDRNGNIQQPGSRYVDWGVFGLGYCPGSASVVSTFRLGTKDHKKLIGRIKKVSLHEMGHNMGLPHCDTPGCFMQDATEKISTIDEVGYELCENCRNKL